METPQRKSHTSLNKIYFWTATIHKWFHLLGGEENKKIILSSLKHLSDKNLITVYGFVIMPNHIHFIWSQDALNGGETPKGSFLKYTAHVFLKQLQLTGKAAPYIVNATNKKHEIWQRDSLGIEVYSKEVAQQKLEYIHFNPVTGKWLLAKDDLDYFFSSARFYESGIDEFGFLNNLYHKIEGI